MKPETKLKELKYQILMARVKLNSHLINYYIAYFDYLKEKIRR